MVSIRHNHVQVESVVRVESVEDALLDAARHCLLAVGWRRTTLTDVSRRAGVSRMTIYRRWPDMATLLSDLMTREWSAVVTLALDADEPPVARIAGGVVHTVRELRENALFRKIVEVDPELLLPYLLDRRGRTQDSVIELLEAAVVDGQKDRSVRPGRPALIARSILLTAHGFALSAQTMTDSTVADQTLTESTRTDPTSADSSSVEELDEELRSLLERYLAA